MNTLIKNSFLFFCFLVWFFLKTLSGQPLVINNSSAVTGIYIVFNGGTSSTPIYMVVNNSAPAVTDIKRINGSNPGWIISEGQYRYTKWMMGTATGNFVLPFGYGTSDYLPFTFNKTTGGASNVAFSTWGTNNQNVPRAGVSDAGAVAFVRGMTGPNGADSLTSVIDRWWDIYASAAVTADLTFSYRGAENTMSINPTGLIDAQHWNGTQWDAPLTGNGTGVTSGVGTTTVTGATTFSPWILIAKNYPLPVDLLYFTASCLDGFIQIDWATATEANADYFTIEKSADGVNFRELTTVPAHGNSATLSQYTFSDMQIETSDGNIPVWYYRLLETDYDGKINIFETIAVKPCSNETFLNEINAWPVGSGYILVKIINGSGKSVDFNAEIFDIGSRNIVSEKLHAATGINHFILNTGQVATGLYVIRVSNDFTNYSKKLLLH